MNRSSRGRHAEPGWSPGARPHRAWFRTAVVTAALAAASVVVPSDLGSAAQRTPPPSLKSLIAQAKLLSSQINVLSEQYDGLRIQLSQAREEERTAAATAARDASQLGAGQAQVGQLAAESYMTGSVDPTLQFISSTDPQTVVARAAIIQQLGFRSAVTSRPGIIGVTSDPFLLPRIGVAPRLYREAALAVTLERYRLFGEAHA